MQQKWKKLLLQTTLTTLILSSGEGELSATPTPAQSPSGDHWLLMPGPLTTSPTVKSAMLHDYGSRDQKFLEVSQRVVSQLTNIINGEGTHVAVPLQGSGTFAIEAMLGTLVPKEGKILIPVNGAYGKRLVTICEKIGRSTEVIEFKQTEAVDPEKVDAYLKKHSDVTHVALTYCETSTGMRNPIEEVAAVVAKNGRHLLIDGMSAFGSLPLDAKKVPFTAVAASANKCLEGVPGMAFCLVREETLEETKDNAHSLSLDLYDQWQFMKETGQWRFTPPVQVLLALDQALTEFTDEGGVEGRGRRYQARYKELMEEMEALGFKPFLDKKDQAPIIVAFHYPTDPHFEFSTFHSMMRERGYLLFPGKTTDADTFRVGCIGRLGNDEIRKATAAIREVLADLKVEIF